MKLKLAFARKVAVGLIAVGSLACLATDTFAANRTWTSSNITALSYRVKWGAAFASNWSDNTVPTVADTAVFGTNAFNQYSLQVQPNTSVGGVRFNSTGTNSYVFGTNGLSIGSQGITNNSGRQQTFGQVTTLLADQTWSSGAGGSRLVFNNVNLDGTQLTSSTDVLINTLQNSAGTSSVLNVSGGNMLVVGGGPDANTDFVVTSGVLTTNDAAQGANYDSSMSSLSVSGGTYNNTLVNGPSGSTNWTDVSLTSSGTIDLMDAGGVMVTNGYAQTGGTLNQYVGWDAGQGLFSSVVQATDIVGEPTGPITLGGAMNIDFGAAGDHVFQVGNTWSLFQGVNAGGAAASNFSALTLANVDVNSPYAGLSFTQYGTEFFTPKGTDGTWLVFQAQSGNLVVVPEPSTIVFAGLGVAMSGWTMWKKRRLSKLLAAKAG